MNIREEARKMKLVAPVLAASSNETRNQALRAIADALSAKKDEIFAANAEDCRAAEENGIAPAVMKRLVFNEAKLTDVCRGIDQLISLPDPIGRSLLKRELDAWECEKNNEEKKVIWQFRTKDARIKLASLYPKLG